MDVQLEHPQVVDEVQLLNALDGEMLKTACELGPVVIHVAVGEADEAERAQVRGEDARDRGSDGGRVDAVYMARDLVAAGWEEVVVDEDERGGAPDGAPAAGEHGGAHCVLDREARDDAAEERVWEGADAVDAVAAAGIREGREAAVNADERVREPLDPEGCLIHVPFPLLRLHGRRFSLHCWSPVPLPPGRKRGKTVARDWVSEFEVVRWVWVTEKRVRFLFLSSSYVDCGPVPSVVKHLLG